MVHLDMPAVQSQLQMAGALATSQSACKYEHCSAEAVLTLCHSKLLDGPSPASKLAG